MDNTLLDLTGRQGPIRARIRTDLLLARLLARTDMVVLRSKLQSTHIERVPVLRCHCRASRALMRYNRSHNTSRLRRRRHHHNNSSNITSTLTSMARLMRRHNP